MSATGQAFNSNMPWTSDDAKRFDKGANTAKKRRQWMHIANSMLASGKSEGAAIRGASGVVGAKRSRKQKSQHGLA